MLLVWEWQGPFDFLFLGELHFGLQAKVSFLAGLGRFSVGAASVIRALALSHIYIYIYIYLQIYIYIYIYICIYI